MAPKNFTIQVEAFAGKTREQMRNVLRNSVQDVLETAQLPKARGGRMPVDTGFLRNSLASGLNGAFGQPDANSYTLTVAGMDLGDVARFAWTAKYAIHQELGTSKFPGNHFVGAAAAQWEKFVAANAARAK
jgi:hypothetical protein